MPPDRTRRPSPRSSVEALFDEARRPGKRRWEATAPVELARTTHVVVHHRLLDRALVAVLLESIHRHLAHEPVKVLVVTPTPQDLAPFVARLPSAELLPTWGGEGRETPAEAALPANDLSTVSALVRRRLAREDPESFTLVLPADAVVTAPELVASLKGLLVETGAVLLGQLSNRRGELPSIEPACTFARTGFFAEHFALDAEARVDAAAAVYAPFSASRDALPDGSPLWLRREGGERRSLVAHELARAARTEGRAASREGRLRVAPPGWRLVQAALALGDAYNLPPSIRGLFRHFHASARGARGHDAWREHTASAWFHELVEPRRDAWLGSVPAMPGPELVAREGPPPPLERAVRLAPVKADWAGEADLVAPADAAWPAVLERLSPRRAFLFDPSPLPLLRACAWLVLANVSATRAELFSRWLSREVSGEGPSLRLGSASPKLLEDTLARVGFELEELYLGRNGFSRAHLESYLRDVLAVDVVAAGAPSRARDARRWAVADTTGGAPAGAVNLRALCADFDAFRVAARRCYLVARRTTLSDAIHTVPGGRRAVFLVGDAASPERGLLGFAPNDHLHLARRLELLRAPRDFAALDGALGLLAGSAICAESTTAAVAE